MEKRSKIGAILLAKCPRCHQGDIFEHPVSRVTKFRQTKTHCPKCDLRYEVEPGFFYGAMYISYAFSVAIFIVFGFATFLIANDPPIWVYPTVVITVTLLLLPITFRYSRVLLLHIVVKYRREAIKEAN